MKNIFIFLATGLSTLCLSLSTYAAEITVINCKGDSRIEFKTTRAESFFTTEIIDLEKQPAVLVRKTPLSSEEGAATIGKTEELSESVIISLKKENGEEQFVEYYVYEIESFASLKKGDGSLIDPFNRRDLRTYWESDPNNILISTPSEVADQDTLQKVASALSREQPPSGNPLPTSRLTFVGHAALAGTVSGVGLGVFIGVGKLAHIYIEEMKQSLNYPGPWRTSCKTLYADKYRLVATCKSSKGPVQSTLLDPRGCHHGIDNIDGKLVCLEVPAND